VSPAQRGGKGARKETQPRRRLERRIQNGHITDPDLLRDPSLALYEKRLVSVDMQKAVIVNKKTPGMSAASVTRSHDALDVTEARDIVLPLRYPH
jgi:hypothetical protein